MPSIRKTKTASGAVAVQVVRYTHDQMTVLKHVGSGHTQEEIAALVASAREWLSQTTKQASLFPQREPRVLPLATVVYLGVTHAFAYDTLCAVARACGFKSVQQKERLLFDLAVMRIIEPTSKLRAIALLKQYFDIHYAERTVYRQLPRLKDLKDELEAVAVRCALGTLKSDLALVLYDVTTLYFETFTADELRMPGFSKDNKPQQPQIVIGLLVTKQGFPLGYELFAGNTFEGKTMISVLEAFADKHHVTTPTIVADAAMLSQENIAELKKRRLSYIVGARLANASPTLIKQIHKALKRQDKATTRLPTKHGDLVASFSAARYRKNKGDMERQIERGKKLVARHEPGRRAKFVTKKGGDAYILNEALIEKNKLLLGIRGYYTNTPAKELSNNEVIARYHDLWHVEQVFRMAKSDLASRPIFHHQEDSVRAHMVVCFAALVIGKYIEIKVSLSLKKIRDLLWDVTDAQLYDKATKKTIKLRSPVNDELKKLLRKLRAPY